MTEKTEEALQLASTSHEGQVDKSGAPYIEHVKRVARAVEMKVAPQLRDHAVTVAYLHDVVEDTDVSLNHIRDVFGNDVAEDVATLTHRDREEYPDYINRVARGSAAARTVKLADLEDHLRDTSHIRADQVEKYVQALGVLTGSRAPDPAG
ncbi:MAG: HD domain-containing protein [Alphaproteobacteria bacterium]|nr:HD domain-containing protein [Alphaproteobacteria bacterium]